LLSSQLTATPKGAESQQVDACALDTIQQEMERLPGGTRRLAVRLRLALGISQVLLLRRLALLLIFAFVGAGLASLPSETRAADATLPSLMVAEPRLQRDLAGYWILKGGVSVSLSPSLIAAIERGVPLEFESIFRARQTHWGFWKRLVYQEKRVDGQRIVSSIGEIQYDAGELKLKVIYKR